VERALDTSPDAFGFLRVTDPALADDGDALRARLQEDGYLYIPGLLGRDAVREARLSVLERANAEGILDPAYPIEDGILRGKINPYFRPAYTEANPALMRVLYGDDQPMMHLFRNYFGVPVRHFDFTWMRVVGEGRGTAPHCDVVYMGRGTHDLLTAWTPLGDIPLTLGGLIVLENSHRRTPVALGDYLKQDVDVYCENGPNAERIKSGELKWEHYDGSFRKWTGDITDDPITLREQLGGRWLTSPEYRMGDVLIFTMRTIHASIDNQTRALRLSTDTRYQPADAPVDARWVKGPDGAAPVGHSLAGKRGRIC
jgi:hypothetical protein